MTAPEIIHVVCAACIGREPLISLCGLDQTGETLLADDAPGIPCVVCLEGEKQNWPCPMCGNP